MRLLLDTNALFWSVQQPERLDGEVRSLIIDPANDVFATLASAHEIATKIAARKWPEAIGLLTGFEIIVADAGFGLISPIATDYLNMTRLPDIEGHRDPLDRLIIAMAMARELVLVSSDAMAESYAVAWMRAGRGTGRARRAQNRIMPEQPLIPISL